MVVILALFVLYKNYLGNFLMEPVTQRVIEGETAIFPCKYSGLRSDPVWIINSTFYVSTSIPTQHALHKVNGTILLHVLNVQPDMNKTTYQCAVYDGNNFIYSSIAYLYVGKLYQLGITVLNANNIIKCHYRPKCEISLRKFLLISRMCNYSIKLIKQIIHLKCNSI